jgi:hypothetical protein
MKVLQGLQDRKTKSETAIAAAVGGWPVLPIYPIVDGVCSCPQGAGCEHPGKHPFRHLTPHGFKEATTKCSQVDEWWRQHPDANLAFVTGTRSGLWVLDVDGPEGLDALARWEQEHGRLPKTLTARTGGGGRHLYFRYPEHGRLGNKVKLHGLPLDVRGDNGYVLLPPSNHISGGVYAWESSLNRAKVAEAPDWLLEIVLSKHSTPAAAKSGSTAQEPPGAAAKEQHQAQPAVTTPSPCVLRIAADPDLATAPGVPEGSRHNRALQLVGAHLARGDDLEEVLAAATAWAQRCTPPFPDKELQRIVTDLAEKHADEAAPPSDWPPPVPLAEGNLPAFPTDALPDWLGQFVEKVATATQTPPDLPATLTLPTVAAACAKRVEVHVKDDYCEPVNVFTATALPPGNRKSTVFSQVTAPLREYERAESQRLRPQIAADKTRLEIEEGRLAKLQAEAVKAKPEEQEALARQSAELARQIALMDVQREPRLLVEDTTPEKLVILLQENEGRMAVLSPEGDVFELMAGRYNKGANFGVYLHGHAGDDLRVDRVGRPTDYVTRPALTLGLAVQPDVIHSLADKPGFKGRGLLGRFLYAMPQSLLGRRDPDPPPVPPEVRDAYHHNVLALLSIPANEVAGTQQPHLLELSPEARRRWIEFSDWLEPQLAPAGELGMMADWGAKLAGAVARLAGILHMAEHAGQPAPWATPIHLRTMEQAIRIGHYAIPHARAAYAAMGADPAVEAVEYVLAWIRKKELDSFTERQAFEGTKGRFHQVEKMRPALALLASHGYIRERPREDRPGPGRKPSPTYDVNPHAHAQNARYSQYAGHLSDFVDSADSAVAVAAEESADADDFEEGVV